MELMQAHNQWATRPDDERFLNLPAMLRDATVSRSRTLASTLPVEQIRARGAGSEVTLYNPKRSNNTPYPLSHWAFSQLAERIKAPADYLRRLPAPLAAENINHGLERYGEQQERAGIYAYMEPREGEEPVRLIRALTGPKYGRIHDADIIAALIDRFGDGLTGDFRVPGKFGKALTENTLLDTTLYRGDRDMFIFLADEEHRVSIPNRRNGKTGEMARGFFVTNSEVGAGKATLAMFLFDFVCENRIVWGAEGFVEIDIRHSSNAPARFVQEALPLIRNFTARRSLPIQERIQAAQAKRIGNEEDAGKFLGGMFGVRRAAQIARTHLEEEGRPIETLFDASTAVTGFAKRIPFQNERVAMERKGGLIIDMAA
jgi:Domain of unknown function (DUF932)